MKKDLPGKRYTKSEREVLKSEREVLKKVRGQFDVAKDARQNGCFHANSSQSKDWMSTWDLQEKIEIGWSEAPKQDEFESNVKSPMSSGRIEATMHKLKRLDLRFTARPDNIKDDKEKRKARVIQELLNNLFERKSYKARLMTWFKDCLVHGTAFLHVYYLQKKREVEMPKTDVSRMDDDEKEKVKNKKKVYEKEYIYDYDDIVFEPVKIQEIYLDPSGRNLHGTSYEAQWLIRRMLPSLEQFKATFENDPDAKNVDKVRAVSQYVGEDVEFFEPPKDMDNDNYVEVLHYYNKADDRYIVLANDVVIKDMPLPYKHKELPFVEITAYEVLHQIYGMGIPDRLKNIQSEEEILKNMTYDRLHLTSNPMLKVKKPIYGEFSKAYQTAEAGLMIPVNNQDDVMPLDYPTTNFDIFRTIDGLNRDAVLATQIDPVQMGVNQKYVSATTSMLTKEQMDSYITALIDNWTESLTIAAKMAISLMGQFYPIPRVSRAGEAAEARQIRLSDIEINPESLEVKESRGNYSYLEIKPEYFNINGDWDIEIAPESVEVQSRAIEMQKSQANLAQLAPFMVDPSNPQSVTMSPTPWIDGPKMLKWYMETNSIPQELMAITQEDEDISRERAEAQGKQVLDGETVSGIPGESEAHKRVHAAQLRVINNRADQIQDKILKDPISVDPSEETELRELEEVASILAAHLEADDMPRVMENQAAIQEAKPQQPQVPMPPGLTPAGGSQPPMPAGGNQQSGMNAMPEGRPPMAEAGI